MISAGNIYIINRKHYIIYQWAKNKNIFIVKY